MGKPSFKEKLFMQLSAFSIKNFFVLILAGIINAIGVVLFLFPVKLYDSGISGLSMLLDQVTPSYLTLPIFLIAINIPIFLFGLKRQGVTFCIYSIFTVGVYSFVSFLITNVLPIDVSFVSPLAGSDLLLCAIFGGVISGIGSGLTIRFGGAIDGIDVLSVIFAKKIGISIGSFVLIFNIMLYIICGVVINSWILPLYSIVTYFVGSKTVDFVVEGISRSKCAMIVTTKADEISEGLAKNFKYTGTIVNAVGGYSKSDKQIIFFIADRFQISKLRTIVHAIDKSAYITLQEVSDIIQAVEENDSHINI